MTEPITKPIATNPKKYNLIIEYTSTPENTVDHTLKITNLKATAQPTTIDLRSKIPIMYDQGELGSCTANALCYSYMYNDPSYRPSRLFLYYNERALDGNIQIDAGSSLSQGINALQKYGVCQDVTWPYIINKFTNKPNTVAYSEAVKHEVLTASRVTQTLSSLKGCLQIGQPFVVGIAVYQSFESDVVTNTGYVPLPNTNKELFLGGHAVICVGYNDTRQVWIMKNSWGSSWGAGGYFYLPYAYLTSQSLAGDIWKITKVKVLSSAQKIMVYKTMEKTNILKLKNRK